jgi:hypothetical protein
VPEGQDMAYSDLSNEALIEQLRRAAATWFKNSDLLMLEEFILRFNRLKKEKTSG